MLSRYTQSRDGIHIAKGDDARFKSMKDIAWAAYHQAPPGLEPWA